MKIFYGYYLAVGFAVFSAGENIKRQTRNNNLVNVSNTILLSV